MGEGGGGEESLPGEATAFSHKLNKKMAVYASYRKLSEHVRLSA